MKLKSFAKILLQLPLLACTGNQMLPTEINTSTNSALSTIDGERSHDGTAQNGKPMLILTTESVGFPLYEDITPPSSPRDNPTILSHGDDIYEDITPPSSPNLSNFQLPIYYLSSSPDKPDCTMLYGIFSDEVLSPQTNALPKRTDLHQEKKGDAFSHSSENVDSYSRERQESSKSYNSDA